MADVKNNAAGVEITVPSATTPRYLFGDGDSGCASQIVVEIDLNGATVAYNFQSRVTGATTWVAQIAFPVDTGTGTTSGSSSMVYQIDASGKEVALNISANDGAPKITWRPLVG